MPLREARTRLLKVTLEYDWVTLSTSMNLRQSSKHIQALLISSMHRNLFLVHIPCLILLGKDLLLSVATESLGGRRHLHRNSQDSWHRGQPCQFSPLLKVLSENDGLMHCTSAYNILENVSHVTSYFKRDVRETAFQGSDSRRKWSLVSSPEHLRLLRMQETMLCKGEKRIFDTEGWVDGVPGGPHLMVCTVIYTPDWGMWRGALDIRNTWKNRVEPHR